MKPYKRFKKAGKSTAVLQNVARSCIAPNTIRIFSEGAQEKLRRFLLKVGDDNILLTAKSREAFDRRLSWWIDRFPGTITRPSGQVSYGHKAKVVNLFLMGLVGRRHGLPQAQARLLEQFLHVPIDSLVHKFLWDPKRGFGREIGKYAHGALKKKNTRLANLRKREYELVQQFLRTNAANAHVEPIWLDYWVWSVRNET